MGYCMTQQNADFFISRDKFSEALVVVKGLAAGTKEYSWVDSGVVLNAETLEDALEEWRWGLEINDDGDVEGIYFNGEKSGDELELFKAIAPFVEPNSYIELLGEDGLLWRYHFSNKTCTEIEPEIDWDIKQKCFNHCPNCGVPETNIKWKNIEWAERGDCGQQEATCRKCGCKFREVYEYSHTEITK